MAKKKRFMETTKGYSRAAEKAAMQAVVEEDFYDPMVGVEDLAEDGAISSLFAVSAEERVQAKATVEHRSEPEPPKESAKRVDKPKPGLLGRVLHALRRLG